MNFKSLAVAGILLCVTISATEAKCSRPRIHWSALGQSVTSSWTVNPGGICVFSNRTGGTTAIYALEVSTKPKHGVIGQADRYSIAYRAPEGYIGSDDFVLSLVGRDERGPGKVTIAVDVTVK